MPALACWHRASPRAFLDTPDGAWFLAALFGTGGSRREAHVPAEQDPPQPRARVPQAQRHQGGAQGAQAPAGQRPQAARRLRAQEVALTGLGFPKSARLLRRAEFVAAREGGQGFAEGPLAASW